MVSDSFVIPWTVAYQTPQSMGFSREEYQRALPFPSPGDLPDLEIEPLSPAMAGGFSTIELPGKPYLGRLGTYCRGIPQTFKFKSSTEIPT